jgi:hypothetical protein
VTAATRKPATITGKASGNSTRHSSWRASMPMPRAASITSTDTSRMPVATLRIRISSENATIVMMPLVLPRPTSGISSASSASVGMV